MPLSRRRFLATGVASTAVAGLAGPLAACAADDGSGDRAAPRYLPFHGVHQAGITHPANEVGLMAAFTVTAADRAELRATLAALTGEIDRLMSGRPYPERGAEFPPLYTGAVGNPPPPVRPVGGGVARRLAVRRPLRPGRSQAAGAGEDAVPGQRPARPGPVPRRPVAHRDQHP